MNKPTSHRLLFNKTKKCQKHQFNMIQPQEKFFIIFTIVSHFRDHIRHRNRVGTKLYFEPLYNYSQWVCIQVHDKEHLTKMIIP